MARGTSRLVLDDFTGGLNTRDDPVGLAANESPYLYDWVPHGEGGAIVQRDGDELYRDFSVAAIDKMFYSSRLGNLITHTADGDIHSYNGTTQRLLYDTGLGVSSVFTEVFSAIEAPVSGGQGPLYLLVRTAGGPFAGKYWDGSAASLADWTASTGTLPNSAKGLLYVGNRVWAWGTRDSVLADANTGLLYWSEIGDPRNWPAANVLQLEPGTLQDYTGAGVVGDLIIVFKRNKAWVIYDLDTGANRSLGGPDVGAKDNNTICSTPIGLFFIDPGRGPMVTDGSSAKPLENGTRVPWENFAWAVYRNDHIYCSDGTLGALYDYNLVTQSWWRHSSTHGALAVDSVNDVLYAARKTTDTVDKMLVPGATLQYGGSTMAPIWSSPHLSLGAPGERKRLRSVRFVGLATAEVELTHDIDSTDSTIGSGSLAAPGLIIPTPGLGRAPSFRVQKLSGTAVRLDQIVVDFQTRKR
jgi:hypothetical protein